MLANFGIGALVWRFDAAAGLAGRLIFIALVWWI
jgi:hypothetical protein